MSQFQLFFLIANAILMINIFTVNVHCILSSLWVGKYWKCQETVGDALIHCWVVSLSLSLCSALQSSCLNWFLTQLVWNGNCTKPLSKTIDGTFEVSFSILVRDYISDKNNITKGLEAEGQSIRWRSTEWSAMPRVTCMFRTVEEKQAGVAASQKILNPRLRSMDQHTICWEPLKVLDKGARVVK